MTRTEELDGKGDKGKGQGLGLRVSIKNLPPTGLQNLYFVTGSSLETRSVVSQIGHRPVTMRRNPISSEIIRVDCSWSVALHKSVTCSASVYVCV